MELVLDTPAVFVPLLSPARYKGAWGGRGSGKSHAFAEMMIEQCLLTKGTRGVCIREVQRTLKESSKRLIEDKLETYRIGAADGFKVFNEVIQTPGDGVLTFQGMQDHNAESIKSLEGFRIAWVEEAQTLSARSLSLLRPTIRKEGSELWFSWNPRRKTDPVDQLLRGTDLPTGSVVVKANWADNPMFPSVLEQERLDCLRLNPEQYDHIWQGGYATVLEGAYYAKPLAEARAQGRIGRVSADPLMALRTFWDIGGTGAKADAVAIWVAQFVGREVRVLDYYEAVGQPLATHLNWMRSKGYGQAGIWLPHDGDTNDKVYDVSYASALREAQFNVEIVPNQGKGAAKARIEALRRLFPSMWFNESTCQPGIDALGWYHEKKDEDRDIGLGPEHDWCFAAGTEVLLASGCWDPIELLTVHSQVLTPCGPRAILRSGIVRMSGKWVTIKGIKSTPEHRYFTNRGLVTAADLQSSDQFWTRDSWGLRILGSLCSVLRLGFMAGITSATREASRSDLCSCTGWYMRLCMVRSRMVARYITSMMTRLTITQKTLKLCPSSCIGDSTSRCRDINAYAESVALPSAVTKPSEPDVARPASERTMLGLSENAEPAYSLTIERDECYFVRGDDGMAYLVANSSHGADAAGLMAVAYEKPTEMKALKYPRITTT